jgi:hypothetical protein
LKTLAKKRRIAKEECVPLKTRLCFGLAAKAELSSSGAHRGHYYGLLSLTLSPGRKAPSTPEPLGGLNSLRDRERLVKKSGVLVGVS